MAVTKPLMIVVCGNSALKAFKPDWDGPVYKAIENSLSEDWRYEGIPVRVIYHPSYKHRQGGKSNTESWNKYLIDIRAALNIPQGDDSEELHCEFFDASEVDDFLAKFRDAHDIGYDLEASSLITTHTDFRVAGVGLAKEGYAAYLRLTDFWDQSYALTDEIKQKIGQFLSGGTGERSVRLQSQV